MRGRSQTVVELWERLKLVRYCEGGRDEEHTKMASNSTSSIANKKASFSRFSA